MNKPQFKIECEQEELETIMNALNEEINRKIADGDNETVRMIAKAIHRVADFTTNEK